VKFSVCPSILLNNRECSTPGVNERVKIPISPLGARGEVKNDPLTLNLQNRVVMHYDTSTASFNFIVRCLRREQ
jgi:hypothetical protein